MFPIKSDLRKVDALSPLLLNFALEYGMRRVQVNQDGLKVSGRYQFLFMTMMLVHLAEAYILYRKTQKLYLLLVRRAD
jgi:hypothetical protein